MIRRPPRSTLFPTRRSSDLRARDRDRPGGHQAADGRDPGRPQGDRPDALRPARGAGGHAHRAAQDQQGVRLPQVGPLGQPGPDPPRVLPPGVASEGARPREREPLACPPPPPDVRCAAGRRRRLVAPLLALRRVPAPLTALGGPRVRRHRRLGRGVDTHRRLARPHPRRLRRRRARRGSHGACRVPLAARARRGPRRPPGPQLDLGLRLERHLGDRLHHELQPRDPRDADGLRVGPRDDPRDDAHRQARVRRGVETARAMALKLQVAGVGKDYLIPVIDSVAFGVEAGEFVCVLGPNGCGKTTLLRIIGGLEPATRGEVLLDGKSVVAGDAHDRKVGVVFQEDRLLPWMTLAENVALVLKPLGLSPAERRAVARRHLALAGLAGFETYYPGRVSGGMRQRAAIARALAIEPDVLLMDEPFGALDAQNRRIMQNEVRRIWKETGRTILFVTHSIEEAVAIGTTLVMMSARPSRIRELVTNDGAIPRGELIERLNTMIMEEAERPQRRALRMAGWEPAQCALGPALPALLASHVVGTRVAWWHTGSDDRYARLLLFFWVLAPERGAWQAVALAAAWTHACIGMHYWLRFRPWYPRVVRPLFTVALLLPTLALAGFVAGGREVTVLARTPGWTEALMRATHPPGAAEAAALGRIRNGFLDAYLGALGAVLVARGVRTLWQRARSIRILYPAGRVVTVPVGFSVLEASRVAGIPHASVCGGRGRCSTCRVRVVRGLADLPPASEAEQRLLARVGAAPDVRLACQAPPAPRRP